MVGKREWQRPLCIEAVTLEQIGLLHDEEELFLVHLPIAITISLVNHFLKLLVSHPLTQLLGHALQVLERDLSCLIVIKKSEGFEDLIFGVSIEDFMCHHLKELFIFNSAAAIVVDVRDHFLNLFLFG